MKTLIIVAILLCSGLGWAEECRIFEFRSEGADGCQQEINKWIKDKKVLRIVQSSMAANSYNKQTIITIFVDDTPRQSE